MNKDNKAVQFLIAFIISMVAIIGFIATCYGVYKLGKVIQIYFGSLWMISYYVAVFFSFSFACEVTS